MFAGARESTPLVYATAVAGLLLSLLPLPQVLSVVWPNVLVLVVLYWSTMTPRAGGMLVAFVAGLTLDLLNGLQLGQHAFAMCLVTYLALRLHLLTRAKPIFEQALFVAIALFVYEAALWAIDGFSGHHTGDWKRWVPVATGAAIWPVITGLLGRLHSPR